MENFKVGDYVELDRDIQWSPLVTRKFFNTVYVISELVDTYAKLVDIKTGKIACAVTDLWHVTSLKHADPRNIVKAKKK